jgi:hypothetical protein
MSDSIVFPYPPYVLTPMTTFGVDGTRSHLVLYFAQTIMIFYRGEGYVNFEKHF